MKRLSLTFSVILLITLNTGHAASLDKLGYSDQQSASLKDIVGKLRHWHYREMAIDDKLSATFLDNYLETLDASKMFFSAQDIASFQKHRQSFDDYFRSGNLRPGFEIFEIYRNRVASRIESLLERLSDPAIKFNFSGTDEVLIDRAQEDWIATPAEADVLWNKRLKLSLLNLKLDGESLEEAKETVSKRYKRQLNQIKQQSSSDAFAILVNSLTALFDPHTKYWPPRTAENFNINMSLSLEGIGAMLRQEEEFTEIVRLIAGGPADKQGQLKSGDRIIGVGEEDSDIVDVVGWRLDDVVALIRGPKESTVQLRISKGNGSDENKVIRIQRDKVKLEDQAAQSETIIVNDGKRDYKIGIIDLPTFYIDFKALNSGDPNYKSSTRDVARLVSELVDENVDGLIVDLRNNGGGSLLEAIDLTDLFIDQGPVVQVRFSDGRIDNQRKARKQALYSGPLMVMVNRFSASASEIFAGAIQDYKRGLVVGTKTFGKGTVQTVGRLEQGNLKLTNAKFYRVSGDSTQHRGIIPDIPLPTLVDVDEVGEASYDHALPWDQIRSVDHAKFSRSDQLVPRLIDRHQSRSITDPDLKHLLAQIKLSRINNSRKTISLNEKVRIEDKENLEQQSLEIENARRLAKNLDPYKTVQAFRDSNDDDEQQTGPRQTIDIDNDVLLKESGHLLADFIGYSEASAEN